MAPKATPMSAARANHPKSANTYILRLHGQFCVVSLPYMDKWSGSEHDLLCPHPERANALATSTGRRLVMKCTWSRSWYKAST